MSSSKRKHPSIACSTGLALCLMALAGLAQPTPAVGQRVAIGVKAGTLGFGGEASIGITRHLAVRTAFNRFGMERNRELGGISYLLTPRLRSATTLVDVHPFGGAFRLSSGLVFNRNEGRLAAQVNPGESLFIGDGEYSSSQVQALDGRIGFKRSAPYAGLGFDNSLTGRGRVSFNFDLGVMFHGHPKARLQGRTTLTGDAREQFGRDLERETEDLQSEIDDLPKLIDYYPVVAFGLKVRP
jgi:hypothetical protein